MRIANPNRLPTKAISVHRRDADRLEEIRRALVIASGGASRTIADAVHAVMQAAEPPDQPPRWRKPESNPQ